MGNGTKKNLECTPTWGRQSVYLSATSMMLSSVVRKAGGTKQNRRGKFLAYLSLQDPREMTLSLAGFLTNLILWSFHAIYPLVMTVTVYELENGPIEIVSFPLRHGDVPSLCGCSPAISQRIWGSNCDCCGMVRTTQLPSDDSIVWYGKFGWKWPRWTGKWVTLWLTGCYQKWPWKYCIYPLKMMIFHNYVAVYQRWNPRCSTPESIVLKDKHPKDYRFSRGRNRELFSDVRLVIEKIMTYQKLISN